MGKLKQNWKRDLFSFMHSGPKKSHCVDWGQGTFCMQFWSDHTGCLTSYRNTPQYPCSKFWSGGTTLSRNFGVRVKEETAAKSHGSPCSPCSTSNRDAPSAMNLGLWQISCNVSMQHCLVMRTTNWWWNYQILSIKIPAAAIFIHRLLHSGVSTGNFAALLLIVL